MHGLHQAVEGLLFLELGSALVNEVLVMHAERVAGLGEAGALPAAAVVALTLRWALAFLRGRRASPPGDAHHGLRDFAIRGALASVLLHGLRGEGSGGRLGFLGLHLLAGSRVGLGDFLAHARFAASASGFMV